MISVRNLAQCRGLERIFRCLHLSCGVLSRGDNSRSNHPSGKIVKDLLNNATVADNETRNKDQWISSPYREKRTRDQGQKALRPKVDPYQTSIILFPGQGVQYVGMGNSLLKLPVVEKMFKDANNILQYDLLDLCLNGPKDKLNQTIYCQPAIFVTSLAALQLMIEERLTSVESCVATAGFSVGEYAALVLANSISFEEGLKLVKKRAEAMQSAAEFVNSGLLTIFMEPSAKLGTILSSAIEYCERIGVENPVCSVANYLYPHCRVLGGNVEALQFIEDSRKDLKIRRCKRIPVSGAFHTVLMKPAADNFANALHKTEFRDPDISVHSNLDGLPYYNAGDIKKKLLKQIYRPVKWEQTIHVLYDREAGTAFPQTFELGPGRSLTTLLRHGNALAAKDAVNINA